MQPSIQTIIKNNRIHYYKKITYSKKYKRIEYLYDIYENGEVKTTSCHNIKNPAVIVYSNNKITRLEYWVKGERHRENAASIITLSNNKVTTQIWYHHNEKLSDEEVESIKKCIDRRRKIIRILIKKRMKNN